MDRENLFPRFARRPVRNVDIGPLQDTFLIASVTTIIIIRLQLWATNYPQLGGGRLHIAHLLWGGLFMLIAIGLLLSFLGHPWRRPAAVIGGVGFGFFIDELGKFVTSDNDYFFKPTAGDHLHRLHPALLRHPLDADAAWLHRAGEPLQRDRRGCRGGPRRLRRPRSGARARAPRARRGRPARGCSTRPRRAHRGRSGRPPGRLARAYRTAQARLERSSSNAGPAC